MAEIVPVPTHESIGASIAGTLSQDTATNQNDLQSLEEEVVVEPPKRSKLRLAAILLAINLSLFTSALNYTLVATSVPTISSQLHSASGYTWIGGAYLLASAAAAPIWIKLSDIWGRKPILLTAVAWFFGASIVCARAVSMSMLIAGRALLGVPGGALIYLTMVTISDLFSMRQRTLYFAVCNVVWAIAGGVGPVIGGLFTQLVSWRWNFWINLPIAGTAFLLLMFLDVHNPKTKAKAGLKAIDWLGSLCFLGLALMLLLGLDFGGVIFPWSSPKVICLIVFGLVMGFLFIVNEDRLAKHPLIPLHTFKSCSNAACLLVSFCHGYVYFAGEYYLPLYFQAVMSASPIDSGLYILPLTVLEALGGILCGIVINRTGHYREFVWAGLLVMVVGNGLYIDIGASSSLGKVIGYTVVTGAGVGVLFEPPMIALQACVAQDDVATATAAYSFLRVVGSAISTVIGGVIVQNGMAAQKPALEAAGLSSELINAFTGGDAAANVEIIKTIVDAGQRQAVKEAFAASLRTLWIVSLAVSALGLVASLLIKRAELSREHTETKTGIKEKRREQ